MPNIPPPPDIPPVVAPVIAPVPDSDSTGSSRGSAEGVFPVLSVEAAAYERRYQRVQDHLDIGIGLERQTRKLTALQLRAIEAGRSEALAIEYAYPQENNATRRTEENYRHPHGGPESDDAVPTRLSTASVADESYTAMVATMFTLSHRAAESLVHTAEPLVNLYPRTLQLLEDGRTCYRRAFLLVDNGWTIPSDKISEYETILLPFAETMTPPQFARKAKAVAATFLTDPLVERHQEALSHRSFKLTPCDDGMANITLYIDAVAAIGIRNRMRAVTRTVFRKDDGRSRSQVEVDVAAEILLTGTTEQVGTPTMDQLNLFTAPDPNTSTSSSSSTSTSTSRVVFREVPDNELSVDDVGPVLGVKRVGSGLGAGILAKVALTIPALTLLQHGTEPAYLESYGPISTETALLLAGNAPGFTRILTHPDTGATLSVGTRMYPVPDAMRMWILYRDGTCRFPGCTRPGKFCDIDHIQDWAKGGETKVTNLVTLCKRHHMLKHNSRWNYALHDESLVTWISPSKRSTTDYPAHHIPVREEGDTIVPDVGTPKKKGRTAGKGEPETIWDTTTIWDAPSDPNVNDKDLPF